MPFRIIDVIRVLILSIPATITAVIGLIIMDPLMRRGQAFQEAIAFGGSGLFATESVVRLLLRTRSGQMFLKATPRPWVNHIRVAQAAGIGCVMLCYFAIR